MDERELREIRQAAQGEGMTVSEWVRQAMRAARRAQAGGDRAAKLGLVRAAARHTYPTADIDAMLAEIEQGSN
jgi:hypothetical protein